jgi:hypothetical protein
LSSPFSILQPRRRQHPFNRARRDLVVTRLDALKQRTGAPARPLRLDHRPEDGQDVQHASDLFRVGFHARQYLLVDAGNADGIEKRVIRGVIPFLEVEYLLEIKGNPCRKDLIWSPRQFSTCARVGRFPIW